VTTPGCCGCCDPDDLPEEKLRWLNTPYAIELRDGLFSEQAAILALLAEIGF
jgi:hypothetical protein